MSPVRIQRKRTRGWKMPPDTVYVGRPTRWGNWHDWREYRENAPADVLWCAAEVDRWSRERAVEAFEEDWRDHIAAEPEARDRLKCALAGKNLACWCPLSSPCHADVLLELANR